ncbi:MAG: hypothetical protein LUD17_05250 [Bacteroidales bacterium]|nr:hypothetical protein [Bacteroidales bacterium]
MDEDMLVFEGVTFFPSRCLAMSKTAFVKGHEDVLWLDKDIKTRRKMLGEAYTLMSGDKAEAETVE